MEPLKQLYYQFSMCVYLCVCMQSRIPLNLYSSCSNLLSVGIPQSPATLFSFLSEAHNLWKATREVKDVDRIQTLVCLGI